MVSIFNSKKRVLAMAAAQLQRWVIFLGIAPVRGSKVPVNMGLQIVFYAYNWKPQIGIEVEP